MFPITSGLASKKKGVFSLHAAPASQRPISLPGFDINHSSPLMPSVLALGLMALKPPSPPNAFCH